VKSAAGSSPPASAARSPHDVELLGQKVVAQVVAFRRVHGRIELDQHVAGLDRLPVLHPDGAHHPGLGTAG